MLLPSVSCVAPTFDRPERGPSLYGCFCASNYLGARELLIADDSPEPSAFFLTLRDPRVRYFWSPVRSTIGGKRNFLARRAHGDVIQHVDDDDLYHPDYTSEMVERLGDRDFVKLSVFDVLHERDGSRWRWDTRTGGGGMLLSRRIGGLAIPFSITDPTDAVLWGFGFSYVYRRALTKAAQFPRINLREDYYFVRAARDVGARLAHVADRPAIVLHAVHAKSTSACFPQERLSA